MKIATYNANSIRKRADSILKWLAHHQPDVLAIQETKVQDVDFPIDIFANAGYHVLFRGQKKYNGVAFLSKHEPKNVVSRLDADPDDQARFLKADFGEITIVNTYIPQGREVDSEKFQYKLDWFGWLKHFFDTQLDPDKPVIWLGDLNVAREDIDVHDPKRIWGHVCFCEPVQTALSEVMDWGLIDVFRKLHPEPDQYTFWDYRVANALERKIGWRLDYIMVTRKLADICTDCRIDTEPRTWESPSDHTYLLADFDI
ncbi:MAG: exodeoxyribonuclease III [Planctomycetota bacterium]|jgi:exodeoxyribonuclease-3